MNDAPYAISQAQLRKDGVRLRHLAAIGQIFTVLGILGIPLILYAIQLPAAPTLGFWAFLGKILITDPTAMVNSYGLMKACVILAMLGRVRHLGDALSSKEPLGSDALRHLKWLSYAIALLIAMMCFSVEIKPDSMMPSVNIATQWKTQWSMSMTPLYLGAIVLLGLSIVRRIVIQAIALKAETQEFV